MKAPRTYPIAKRVILLVPDKNTTANVIQYEEKNIITFSMSNTVL